jgi:hypothetical protein
MVGTDIFLAYWSWATVLTGGGILLADAFSLSLIIYSGYATGETLVVFVCVTFLFVFIR